MMKFLPKPPDSPSPSAVQALCPGLPRPPDSPGPSAVQAWCPGLLQIIPVQLTKGPDGRILVSHTMQQAEYNEARTSERAAHLTKGPDGRILVSHAMQQAKPCGSVTADSSDGKDSQGQDQGGQGQSRDQGGQGQSQGHNDSGENSKENSVIGESISSLEDSSASVCMSSMNSTSSGSKVLTLRRRTTPTKLRLLAKDLPVSESISIAI